MIGIIVLLHRYAPDFKALLRWYLPGATFTLVLTVLAMVALRLYFARTGIYAEAYGVFGAVLVFMFFLFVVGIVILIGDVVNAAVREDPPGADSGQQVSVHVSRETSDHARDDRWRHLGRPLVGTFASSLTCYSPWALRRFKSVQP